MYSAGNNNHVRVIPARVISFRINISKICFLIVVVKFICYISIWIVPFSCKNFVLYSSANVWEASSCQCSMLHNVWFYIENMTDDCVICVSLNLVHLNFRGIIWQFLLVYELHSKISKHGLESVQYISSRFMGLSKQRCYQLNLITVTFLCA